MNTRYGLDSSSSQKQLRFVSPNFAIKDTSKSLLERNAYLMNSKIFDKLRDNYSQSRTLAETNKHRNNYLDPIATYQIKEFAPSDSLNKETLNLLRLKYYSSDAGSLQPSNINQGTRKSYFDYKADKSKDNQTIDASSSLPKIYKENVIKQNLICFDKNAKGEVLRHPKGFWDFSQK